MYSFNSKLLTSIDVYKPNETGVVVSQLSSHIPGAGRSVICLFVPTSLIDEMLTPLCFLQPVSLSTPAVTSGTTRPPSLSNVPLCVSLPRLLPLVPRWSLLPLRLQSVPPERVSMRSPALPLRPFKFEMSSRPCESRNASLSSGCLTHASVQERAGEAGRRRRGDSQREKS